jgi:amino acid transporter
MYHFVLEEAPIRSIRKSRAILRTPASASASLESEGKNTGGPGSFLRGPSGLFRAFSLLDGFIYGVYADSIVIAAALTYSLVWPWPDANIPLGILMVCLAFLPMFTVYAMLTGLMPRAGGDYVWQTRTLGGFWGYILVFTPILFGPWFYMASNVAPGSGMVAAPLFISLGKLLGAPALISFAASLGTPIGTWWFYVFYVTFSAVVLGLGMRLYARIQRWSFLIGSIAVLSWIIWLLCTTRAEFQSCFNGFMADTLHWGKGHAYQEILALAQAKGFHGVPLSRTSVKSSFLIGPVLAYTFMYIAWTGTLAGEIKGVGRFKNAFGMYWGGNLFSMLVCAGFLWLLLSRIGNVFFTSANYIWASGNAGDMPVAPYYGLFLLALSKNPWAWLWIALGLNAWFWIWPTNNMVGSTRVMFAMSCDGMLPSWVARVSRRWGAPVVAIGICYVGCLIMGWLYLFTDFARLTLDMPLMSAIAFAASTLAGTLFPYLKTTRHIYKDSSVARYKVLGIPLITVAGVLGLIYFAVIFRLYLTDGRYGVNDRLSAVFILASIAVSVLIYLGCRYYRRQGGIDIDRVFRDIPVD